MDVGVYKSTEEILAGLKTWRDHISFQDPNKQQAQHTAVSALWSLSLRKLILFHAT